MHISVDMVTDLVPSKDYDAILVIVNQFSKAIIPIACSSELLSEGWACILCNEVYAKYSMPVTVISDQGPQFVSKFLKDLYIMLQIKGNMSTAFHLQTNGQTECANQEIEKYLRIFINHRQTDWPDWLPLAASQHNNHYDKKKKATIEYKIGNKVWLNTTNLHLARPKKKLDDKHISPFTILEKHSLSAYKLKLPPAWKIYPIFNETLLTPYTPPAFSNQEKPPPPPSDIIMGKEEYEVESILDHKTCKVRGRVGEPSNTVTDYLIKWKGYGPEEHKWTKESELDHAKEAIAEYLKSREGVITVQAIVVQPNTATFILNSC
ncbi:uncharacterized protein ARMOST_11779 [Armillaria ostoyae]|uniref:Chromo domain-containing protein n=1 Tax=Armillaria ostoyae TaxID=47428 RepID=A0A284RI34_ARMOS|nr:uncharacterized protein ARMOST_11779 [Armillaria ostoyae]